MKFNGFEICILVALSTFTGFCLGGAFESSRQMSKSIEAGVAQWTIDAKTGEKRFEYITPTGTEVADGNLQASRKASRVNQ